MPAENAWIFVPVKHWVPFPISPIPGATLAVAGPLPHVPGD